MKKGCEDFMSEWNAIDLHLHTVSGFTRDKSRDEVNFSYSLYGEVLKKYDIKLMAVTNHNFIDMINFILMKHLASMYNSNILMGVELDSNLSIGTPIHIACIFNENFQSNFLVSKAINELTDSKRAEQSEIVFTSQQIIDLLKEHDFIMIPHGNKDKGIFKNAGKEQIDEALKKIKEGFVRIFDSPSDWKLAKIKNYLKEIGEENLDQFGGVLFSDNRNWKEYDKNYRDFYMNAEATYRGLLHSITNPVKRFRKKDDIGFNSNYIKKIILTNIEENGRIVDSEILFSAGYNCVIGKSGTGKTLLLHLIQSKLSQEYEDNNENYKFANKTDIKIYNEKGILLDKDNINVGKGVNLFDKIIKASASNDNNDYYEVINLLSNSFEKEEKFGLFKREYNQKIKEYCDLKFSNVHNISELKSKMIKFSSDTIKLNELKNTKTFDVCMVQNKTNKKYAYEHVSLFSQYEIDIQNLEEKAKVYKGMKKQKINELLENLKKYLIYAYNEMIYENTDYEVETKKIDIINSAIKMVNKGISTQAAEKANLMNSIPLERNEIVKKILEIYKNNCIMDCYDLSVRPSDYNCKKIISEKGNVVVQETIDSKVFEIVNEKENKIFNTYGKKGSLDKDKNYNLMDSNSARKLIDKYITFNLIDNSGNYISNNLKPDVKVYFDGQNINQLNPGDIAKKYIELYFDEQINHGINSVVLFDQIENDVDKDFISNVIKKLIEETKGKVQLIVVTHDPIVAVNADPNNYIESIKENNKIRYRNFVAESSLKDELETIANTVDGSKYVIKSRYEIYEEGQ